MIRHYFRNSCRSLLRNKFFSIINIIGLSIGISASLLIYLIVSYNYSFNQSPSDRDRIYRIVTNSIIAGEVSYNGGVTYPLSDALRRELTGVDLVAPIFTWFPERVTIPISNNEPLLDFTDQRHIVFADEQYFNLIKYDWLEGSPNSSLSQPHQVVLTESNANLYFPNVKMNAIIGKRIYFRDTVQTIVTGIVKDLAYPTDFLFKTFISRSTLEKSTLSPVKLTDWGPTIGLSQVFIKLSPGVTPQRMEYKIGTLAKKYGIRDDAKESYRTTFKLQPLSDLHFNHTYGNIFGYDEISHKPTLYGLMTVAIFLLMLACINFINLHTAESSHRAKEIGIRKTIGGSRKQLIVQFLFETFLLTLLALLLSLLMMPFFLKVFADFVPSNFHLKSINIYNTLLFLFFLLVIVTSLSGFYPAFVLSSYKPVLVLKDSNQDGTRYNQTAWFRRVLTVLQFIIAQVFVIATLIVSKQINYSLQKDMGFKKEAIINFYTSFHDTASQKRFVLINKLKSIPGISMVSLSGDSPFSVNSWKATMKYQDGTKDVETELDIKYIDTNYCRLYQIKLLAGSQLPYSDTIKYLLINQTYAHVLGFTNLQEAVGKNVEWNNDQKTIVGVVADFHQRSLHLPIKPMVLTSQIETESLINVALAHPNSNGSSWKPIIKKINDAWSSVYPKDDFKYTFQDEEIEKAYKSEQQIAVLLGWATVLSIFISSLGLLGLIIFIARKRTKEIGIRKLLGATVSQIIFLLASGILRLIGWSFIIAVSITWWLSHKWLENFAYRLNPGVWVFLAGGIILAGFALTILLLSTFRVAMANPAKSLRNK